MKKYYLRVLKDFIADVEGYKSQVYLCSAGHPTIGYGHKLTLKELKEGTFENRSLGYQEAEEILEQDLLLIINQLKIQGLNNNQYAAIISLCFNVGVSKFLKSNCYKELLKGIKTKDFLAFEKEFIEFRKSNGKVMESLSERRHLELALFFREVN